MDPPQRGGYRAPDKPGRPAELTPYKKQDKTRFPSAEQLEDDEQRAILLHFFANHELLAVELMALALLKFPDAPDAFRRGVFHTLREEQNHTKWYVQRMKECGVNFGDLPVSPMIWEHIAEMESPLDYVSRLSLTFEQANLDYARHYSQILENVGDTKSAKILHTIYHDEIAHVGLGIKWLRKWKEQSQSDWDAWNKQLHIPLSPMRAKGMAPFNEEGRRKAGLNEEWITSLKRYHSSRGRSPDFWFFNPDAEIAAANSGWTCPQKIDDLAADLEPAFALAAPTQDDLVFLRRIPSDAHRDQLAKYTLTFPEIAPLSEIETLKKTRKHRSIRPWAEVSPFLSKENTLRLRERLPDHLNPVPAKVCAPEEVGKFISLHPYQNWVAKDLFSAAGRGIHRFSKNDLSKLPKRDLLIEPWLEKTTEFSLLFHRYPEAEGGLRYLGITYQETSKDGQWISSSAPHKPARDLPPNLARQLSQEVFLSLKDHIQPALLNLLEEEGYSGPLCLDSFFYGESSWQPVVEINPRWTMGRLAHQLRQKVCPSRKLTLSTCPPNQIPKDTITLGDPAQAESRVPIITIH
ncbi:MAG: DUF455 family protein [Akkermansiaceae bacterium]